MATEKAKPTYKFPKTIGECADKLYELKAKRLAGQKLVDEVEAEEKALKAHIINTLPKSEASGVAGKIARVTIVTRDEPQISNADDFHKYITKTKRWDLMQNRLSPAGIKEMWEAGKEIPGVSRFNVVTLSLNKV
jgi:hypothetical protein